MFQTSIIFVSGSKEKVGILENQGNTVLMKTLTIPSLSNETNENEF